MIKNTIKDQSEYAPILFLDFVTVKNKYIPKIKMAPSRIIVPTTEFHKPNPTKGLLDPDK